MKEISVLIGGKAGDGINQSGFIVAKLLGSLGYYVYMYFDYPSLIRGGHNFAIIRASENKITSHKEGVDYILALNQETIDIHKSKLKNNNQIIFDSDTVKSEGTGVPLSKIAKEENAKTIMRNSSLIGAFAKSAGIDKDTLTNIIKENIKKEADLNIKLANRGYELAEELSRVESWNKGSLPIITGNEAIGMGLIQAGLEGYIAYPMTPSSSILHYLAANASKYELKVIHPENEIAVILMALGFSYAGKRVAVGTSGGGFALMTESLSLAGMAELPLVIIVSQRPGPSTGMPTYTAQGDLNFVLNAGHGEFLRFVVSPGDAEQAYYWSAVALNISWKYQIPSIILSDKTLSEGSFSFNKEAVSVDKESPLSWDRRSLYKRYANTDTGISPITFPPDKDAIVKVNSYEHDEFGITTEDSVAVTLMQEKRFRKEQYLRQELERYRTIEIYGNKRAPVSLLCWGSSVGPLRELTDIFDARLIQPLVLSPFPVKQLQEALKDSKKIITVESNSTGQLFNLLKLHGLKADLKILKYDGRPFTPDELEEKIRKLL